MSRFVSMCALALALGKAAITANITYTPTAAGAFGASINSLAYPWTDATNAPGFFVTAPAAKPDADVYSFEPAYSGDAVLTAAGLSTPAPDPTAASVGVEEPSPLAVSPERIAFALLAAGLVAIGLLVRALRQQASPAPRR